MEKEIDRQIISEAERKSRQRYRQIHRDFDRDREEIGLNANTIEEKGYKDFDTKRDVSIK